MGSLMSYKRPQGFGRVTVKKSGLKPSRWKAGCGESRTSGLERGKGWGALPIVTEEEVEPPKRNNCQTCKIFVIMQLKEKNRPTKTNKKTIPKELKKKVDKIVKKM